MRRYGNKARSKADKRAAALAFVTLSERSPEEKIETLVRSYGFNEPEAREFVHKHGRAA